MVFQQVFSQKTLKTEHFMETRVTLIDEFIDRFNYQITPEGKLFDSLNRANFSREICLFSLFEENEMQHQNNRSEFQLLKRTFVEQMIGDSVFLSSKEALPYALIENSVLYKNKEQKIRLYLKKFKLNGIYDWKIIDAEADFLPITNDSVYVSKVNKDTSQCAISPHAQETAFLSLKSCLLKSVPLLKLVTQSEQQNQVLIGLSKAIEQNEVTLNEFETSIILDTEKGWQMKLEYFTEEKLHSGWLISELYGGASPQKLPQPIQNYRLKLNKN